jgi:hypothetical protein
MNLPFYKPKGRLTSSPIAMPRNHIDLTILFNYVSTTFYIHRQATTMADHTHRFIETFEGFIGFGLNRESDMDTVIYYLQKFSDDQLMNLLRNRLSDEECQAIFDLLSGLLRKHLSESEYHRYFLKDDHG